MMIEKADVIVYGKIYTSNAAHETVEAFASPEEVKYEGL